MTIYVFNLLVGYLPNGIDNAQGYRATMLEKICDAVRYVFTEQPEQKYVKRYERAGIPIEQMYSAHQSFTDNQKLRLSVTVKEKISELKNILNYTSIEQRENETILIKDSSVIATVITDGGQTPFVERVHYYSSGRLIRTEYYTDRVSYTDYYITAKTDTDEYAKLVRRTFYNSDGSVAYDQIFEEEKEWYVFPNGMIYTKSQFLAEFIKKLEISEQDILLLDRSSQFDFVQPLFQFGNKARMIAVFHSGHYFEKNEDPYCLYLNYEYYYWFKYSGMIDTMVVSTQEQKEELTDKLTEYGCHVPKIVVIPAGGIRYLRYPEQRRKPYSLLTVSRLDQRKKIDWIIRSVVKAHQKIPDLSLDIYGNGIREYTEYLQKLVSEYQAGEYIRFMGYADVAEIYQEYQVFITASLGETLGLSLMEAVGSGLAMIGLDVKYGNHLFIQPERNGYLIDFNLEYVRGNDGKLIDNMADKIVEIFADEERLERFQQKSYEIGSKFLSEVIEEKWKRLLLAE